MSVFDVAKNNRGNDEIGIYTSYARFDEYLHMAQAEERVRIKQIVQDWFDYDGDMSEGSKNLLEWIDEEYDE